MTFSVVVCLRCLYHHRVPVSYISREIWILFLVLLCCLMICANNRAHYGPMFVFVCFHITLPHYHHYADVSESIELLKCLSGTFFPSVCLILKSIISIIFHAIYGAGGYVSLKMFVRMRAICLVVIIKSEVWPVCHLWLGHEVMPCAVCLFIFLRFPILPVPPHYATWFPLSTVYFAHTAQNNHPIARQQRYFTNFQVCVL